MINEYLIDPDFIVKMARQLKREAYFSKYMWGLGTHRYCLRTLDDWEAIPVREKLSLREKDLYEYFVREIVKGAQITRNLEYFDWEGKITWRENAEKAVEAGGFFPIRMVFSEKKSSCNLFFNSKDITDIDKEDEFQRLWKSDINTQEFDRTAEQLAEMLGSFFCASKSIIWVDPYFSANRRYASVVKALFKTIASHGRNYQKERKLFIITKERFDGDNKCIMDFWNEVTNLFSSLHLSDTKVFVILAEEGSNPRYKFHDRFMLSELGGVGFPGGTDEAPGRDMWSLSILERERVRSKLDYYKNIVSDSNDKTFLKEIARQEFGSP